MSALSEGFHLLHVLLCVLVQAGAEKLITSLMHARSSDVGVLIHEREGLRPSRRGCCGLGISRFRELLRKKKLLIFSLASW